MITTTAHIPRCDIVLVADADGHVDQCEADSRVALRDGRFVCFGHSLQVAAHSVFDEATGTYREAA